MNPRYPGGPGGPGGPRGPSPAGPRRPRAPLTPVTPGEPMEPVAPVSPVNPVAPVSPGGPGGPVIQQMIYRVTSGFPIHTELDVGIGKGDWIPILRTGISLKLLYSSDGGNRNQWRIQHWI